MDDRFNRATLRNFFADGQLPTGKHFGYLIDSMLNMVDEGFSKTPQDGLKISSAVTHNTLASFYRDNRQQERLWSLGFAEQADRLQVERDGAADPVLSLDAHQAGDGPLQGRVGINTGRPQHALHVEGTISAHGRIGGLPLPGPQPMADGEWHDVTGELGGCQGFELMAGAGREGSGQFALLHAVALNAYNPGAGLFDALFGGGRKRIREDHAWYGKRCDRLQLRWHGGSGRNAKYRLQIRSRCTYGDGVPIQVHLTRLWFDPFMKGPQP